MLLKLFFLVLKNKITKAKKKIAQHLRRIFDGKD
jgi:hypothetical protein